MRVGIISFMHESNTFICQPTVLRHFQEDWLLEGEAIRTSLAGSHHEIAGFFDGLEREACEADPLFVARAVPFGTIDAGTYAGLSARIIDRVEENATKLDGLLVALHGAAVSESVADADGELLARIRKRFGPTKPIIVTLDAHANLSPLLVSACNAVIVYRTNPHIDQRERGVEAARLLARVLCGAVRPVLRASFPPLVINIDRQCTSDVHWQPVHEAIERVRNEPGVLSASIVLGFPYADVAEMGAATVVVTDNDERQAQQAANDLARALWSQRNAFIGQLMNVDEAIQRAREIEGPVCMLDMGDNVGGGSPGDGTFLAEALKSSGLKSFACICDPESARQAADVGVGGTRWFAIGGKTDDQHGQPLTDEFQVLSVSDGLFEEPEVRHGCARHFDQGLTTVVTSGTGLTLMVTSRRVPPFSLQQLLRFGVEPSQYQVLVAKGVNAPLAAYRVVCRHFLRVDTGGVTAANLEHFRYKHRRRPLFPFEPAAWP